MGLEGFSGNESILYHLTSPCRVSELGCSSRSSARNGCPTRTRTGTSGRWASSPRATRSPAAAAHVERRRRDLALPPAEPVDFFYRNGEGDEVIFVHEGSGTLETIFGDLPYSAGDYVVVPRGTTYRFVRDGPQRHLVFESPGLIEIPRRYRNEYGQLLEHAPYYHRDIHPPTELRTHRDQRRARGEGPRRAATRPTSSTTTRSTSSAGTATSIRGRSRSTTSSRSPAASTCRRRRTRPSQGRNFVICSFCPRKLDFDPDGDPDPVPPFEPELGGDDLLRRRQLRLAQGHRGRLGDAASLRIPHGPQPGLAEKSIGMTETHELAVMCDTFHPLRLTKLAQDLDDGKYAYSWYEEPDAVRRQVGRTRIRPASRHTSDATPRRPAGRATGAEPSVPISWSQYRSRR